MSYNMYEMQKSLSKLHGMPKIAKLNIKSNYEILMLQKGKNPKNRGQDQGKGNEKVVVKTSKVDTFIAPKPRSKPKKPKPSKERECYHCKKIGHWERNYPLYLEELKNNKGSVPLT
ncbi:putative polyprotein [Cucumis melo var. makuwa]|uniref:Polyprotein n=1 Tax=Cucumis melo var. makuwa TaxID=1194695 RepID=A0A5D3CZL7_CUCMM|nr:putative polyprotein [Cucumis melo var. makuwa]TYK15896.1 putative polyprotein [Cucumis melo var. makuwa]